MSLQTKPKLPDFLNTWTVYFRLPDTYKEKATFSELRRSTQGTNGVVA